MINKLSCDETFARLDDYLDRELTPEEAAEVRAHLDICHQCTSEFHFEAGVLEGLRAKLRRIQVPGGLAERISRAIRGTEL